MIKMLLIALTVYVLWRTLQRYRFHVEVKLGGVILKRVEFYLRRSGFSEEEVQRIMEYITMDL